MFINNVSRHYTANNLMFKLCVAVCILCLIKVPVKNKLFYIFTIVQQLHHFALHSVMQYVLDKLCTFLTADYRSSKTNRSLLFRQVRSIKPASTRQCQVGHNLMLT